MFPIEDLCLDQQFSHAQRKAFAKRVRVFAEIRVMNESSAADSQFGAQFAEIGFDNLPFYVHQRIEAKNEIDRLVRKNRQ